MRIILASSSPRRKELFSQLGLEFEIIPSGVNENIEVGTPPDVAVRQLALRKAVHIARLNPDALVIGADSMVLIDGKLIGKPSSKADAQATLELLNGRSHIVLTGVAVVDTQTDALEPHSISKTFQSTVTFKETAKQTLVEYVATGEPMDKAGSYSRSGIGKFLIKSIEGSADNVSGLPIDELREMLRQFGV